MTEATFALLISGWFAALLYSRYIVRTHVNPIVIFTSMWLVVTILFHARFLEYDTLDDKTYWVISIGYHVFTMGLMFPFLFFRPYQRTEVDYGTGFPHRRFNRLLYIFYLTGMLGLILLYREVTNFFTLSQLLDPFTLRQLRQMFIEDRIGGRSIQYLLLCSEISLIFSFFYAIYFKKGYLRVVLFFLPMLFYSLLSTSRSETFMYIFDLCGTFVFIRFFVKNEPIKKYVFVIFPLLLIASFGGIGFLLFKVLKFTRHIDTQNILEIQSFMFYHYIASPIGALNELLLEEPHILEYGKNIFAPMLRFLQYFIDDIDSPPMRQAFVHIPYKTNVYTYIRVIYKDFGLIGITMIPFFIGVIVSSLWGRLSHAKDITFLPVSCHLAFVICMTTFEDLFFRTTPLLKILFALLFLKIAGVRLLSRRISTQLADKGAGGG